MHVKICGITRPSEIDLLASLAVDLVGLWHGVPGGHADLPLSEFRRLAAAARATHRVEPVLVTFLDDAEALRDVIRQSRVRWVQLHGYQTPSLVRALRRVISDEVRIVKVLHVQGDYCLEAPLIRSYEKAGVDAFLFDAVTADGRLGSTGRSLDASVVSSLTELLTRPFLLAGGINSENWREYAGVIRNPSWLGIDVDTNARGWDGALRPENIDAIVQAWYACVHYGHHHV